MMKSTRYARMSPDQLVQHWAIMGHPEWLVPTTLTPPT